MTSKEFVIWLKGFTEGVHEFNITPKQWDTLKEKLAQVNDDNTSPFPFGTPNIQQITPTPFIQPPPTDPYNPFKITCGSGSSGTITTYNPSTSTTYGYPSGSAWHYTNS